MALHLLMIVIHTYVYIIFLEMCKASRAALLKLVIPYELHISNSSGVLTGRYVFRPLADMEILPDHSAFFRFPLRFCNEMVIFKTLREKV
jgi:hypothetical protein